MHVHVCILKMHNEAIMIIRDGRVGVHMYCLYVVALKHRKGVSV